MAGNHNFRDRLSRIKTKRALSGTDRIESPFDRPITFWSHFEFMRSSIWKGLAVAICALFVGLLASHIPPEVCSPLIAVVIGLIEMFQSYG